MVVVAAREGVELAVVLGIQREVVLASASAFQGSTSMDTDEAGSWLYDHPRQQSLEEEYMYQRGQLSRQGIIFI